MVQKMATPPFSADDKKYLRMGAPYLTGYTQEDVALVFKFLGGLLAIFLFKGYIYEAMGM
jgi:hypothetical protein